MRSKKILVMALSVVASVAILLAACAPAATPAPEATPAPTVRVAILMPGPIADGGWDTLAYLGLEQLSEEGFDTAYTENVGQADIPSVARGYADEGYDLIIGHGFEYITALMEIAPEYPDIYFFVTSTAPEGETIPPNLQFVDPSYHYMGYMAGALAALVSEAHVVGFVGGGDNPVQRAMSNAFAQGAEETVPGTTAMKVITGDYNDATRGREAALTMIGNGADVIWHAADVTGLGAIAATVEAGAIAIGCYSDQTTMAYHSMASSTYMDLGYFVATKGHEVRDGTFEGGIQWVPPFDQIYHFVAGPVTYNPEIVSDDVAARMEEILQGLRDGSIEIPYVTD